MKCPDCGLFMTTKYYTVFGSILFASYKKVIDKYECKRCGLIITPRGRI